MHRRHHLRSRHPYEREDFIEEEEEEEDDALLPACLTEEFIRAEALERRLLLLHVGKDMIIRNIPISLTIGGKQTQDWIHTYEWIDGEDLFPPRSSSAVKEQKPVLVMLHGYGGGSLLFARSLRDLSVSFKVYCLDIIGLSLSSRPDVKNLRKPQAIIDFFVESIDRWVDSIGITVPFTLLGHSFGGYIAACYTSVNAKRVRRLILLSPAGMSRISKTENEKYNEERKKSLSLKGKFFHAVRGIIWRYEVTYEWMYTKCFFLPRQTILAHMISTRLNVRDAAQCDIWKQFYHAMLSLPESTSSFVYKLFFFPRVIAHLSLEEILQSASFLDAPVKTHIAYGETDWMNRDGSIRLAKNHPKIFEISKIRAAGHHINIDNPAELAVYVKSTLHVK